MSKLQHKKVKLSPLLMTGFSVFALVCLLLLTIFLQWQEGGVSIIASEFAVTQIDKPKEVRGVFYDRNGEKLVINRTKYLFEIKTVSKSLYQQTIKRLADIGFNKVGASDNFDKVTISNLSLEKVLVLQDVFSELDTSFSEVNTRIYKYPSEFAHILGYTGIASSSDISNGALVNQRVGKYKLELDLNSELSGLNSDTGSTGGNVYYGDNVLLTVDAQWQRTLFDYLARKGRAVGALGAAAVILDTSNGEVMASASFPSYNSNEFERGVSNKRLMLISGKVGVPLLDKVSQLQASPGSTFKLVSAYSLLENGTIDGQSTINSQGCMRLGNYDYCEFGKNQLGLITVRSALSRSSNIFFCRYGLDLVNKSSWSDYSIYAEHLGIGERLMVPGLNSLAGFMPTEGYKKSVFGEAWYAGDTCNSVIGQGMVLVTPLQMAMVSGAIYNQGKMYEPTLIKEIQDQTGATLSIHSPKLAIDAPMHKATRGLLLGGMADAVRTQTGTAHSVLANVPGNPRVKTGTAEAAITTKSGLKEGTHGWVVGLFDHEGRTYSVAILMYFGGGGWNATPVLADFLNCLNSDFRNCR